MYNKDSDSTSWPKAKCRQQRPILFIVYIQTTNHNNKDESKSKAEIKSKSLKENPEEHMTCTYVVPYLRKGRQNEMLDQCFAFPLWFFVIQTPNNTTKILIKGRAQSTTKTEIFPFRFN